MGQERTLGSRLSKHPWILPIAAVLLVMVILLALAANRLQQGARERLAETLAKRFDADVRLDDVKLTLFPRITASGSHLEIRPRAGPQFPPMLSIRQFSAETGLLSLLRRPSHVRHLRLEGLEIHIPPRKPRPAITGNPGQPRRPLPFVLEEIVADNSLLEIRPITEGKEPLVFDLRRLTFHSVGVDRPMSFQAALMNARPPGLIQTTGLFGPWHAEDAGATPLSGDYQFRDADLSVFKGISGKLSSTGRYNGQLDRIEVGGDTDTPDFALKTAGNTVHLKTQFHAVVDGTDGNTLLQPVDARFLHTHIIAQGGVTGTPGVKGKSIALDVSVSDSHLEDLLRLAVKGANPPMTGDANLRVKLLIPPGDVDVIDKLMLQGKFHIASAKFTSLNIQEKLASLSNRAQGRPEEGSQGRVVSNVEGDFRLANANANFANLSFHVPGAVLNLDGTYGLHDETLDFRGKLRLEAKVSETVTGFKSVLLKTVDPFFKKKGAGALLPLKITGTRDEPSFGLALGK